MTRVLNTSQAHQKKKRRGKKRTENRKERGHEKMALAAQSEMRVDFLETGMEQFVRQRFPMMKIEQKYLSAGESNKTKFSL